MSINNKITDDLLRKRYGADNPWRGMPLHHDNDPMPGKDWFYIGIVSIFVVSILIAVALIVLT